MVSKQMKKCSVSLDIRETHTKTIVGHYTPTGMTKIKKIFFKKTKKKKIHHAKCWWGCGVTEIYMLRPCTLKTVCSFPKNLNIYLPYNPIIPLFHICPKESIHPCKVLCTNVHGSCIWTTTCNSQELETTQTSTHGWRNKKCVVYPCHGVVFSINCWYLYQHRWIPK